MLKALTNKSKIRRAHNQLKRELLAIKPEQIITTIGNPSGNLPNTPVQYSPKLDLWWTLEHLVTGGSGRKRYWNCYGKGRPSTSSSTGIAVEINYPEEGRYLAIAAMFARDESNNTYLVHSGKIGGGRKGIGKNAFLENFRGEYRKILIDQDVFEYALVCQLGDEQLPYQIADFVNQVLRIKDIAVGKIKSSAINKIESKVFSPEFTGIKTYNLPEKTIANCNHGLIINTLEKELKALGYQTGNSKKVDLFAYKKETFLFEAKSSLSTQAIYTGIGQLMLYSLSFSKVPKKILVLPANASVELLKDLKKLNVDVLLFKLGQQFPSFPNLHKILT